MCATTVVVTGPDGRNGVTRLTEGTMTKRGL